MCDESCLCVHATKFYREFLREKTDEIGNPNRTLNGKREKDSNFKEVVTLQGAKLRWNPSGIWV